MAALVPKFVGFVHMDFNICGLAQEGVGGGEFNGSATRSAIEQALRGQPVLLCQEAGNGR